MPDCAKFHQNRSNSLWDDHVFFRFFKMVATHHRFLNFWYCIGWIQISSKSVDALCRYSDFTIFQYDYNWPFGPQNYDPHFTHMTTLMIRKFWFDFTRCHPHIHAAGRIFANLWQYRIGLKIVNLLLVADSLRAGVSLFRKRFNRWRHQSY